LYEGLQIVHDRNTKQDVTIILGDMNAKVGTEVAYQPVTGKHTLHEKTNDNVELICEYAASNNIKL
jgi:hypothetical protein